MMQLTIPPKRIVRVLKILVLGEGGVGKTSLIKTFVFEQPSMSLDQTLGAEFFVKTLDLGDEQLKLQLWDLAGQDHFKNMQVYDRFCQGAHGALLCFDLSDVETLFRLEQWIEYLNDETKVVVVGTKSDLVDVADNDEFIEEYIRDLRKRYPFIQTFHKTSIFSLHSVTKVFLELIDLCL